MQSKIKSKYILIDWNRTLSNSLFWSQISNKKHPYNKYYKRISEYLFIQNKKLVNLWMRGQYSSEQICAELEKVSGLNKKIILRELVVSSQKMKFVSPKIPSLIRKIRRKGHKVIVATDNMDTFMRYTVPAMSLEKMFDGFLVSYELKCLKKDIKNKKIMFLESYIKENAILHSDFVLFDDSIDMKDDYQKAGIKVVTIKNPRTLIKKLSEYAA